MSENQTKAEDAAAPTPWLERKENVSKIAWTLYLSCAILVFLDLSIHRHAEMGFDGNFGFYGAYGFFASVILVFAAKQMRKLLKRPEDYYDD
mgnify:FL=1